MNGTTWLTCRQSKILHLVEKHERNHTSLGGLKGRRVVYCLVGVSRSGTGKFAFLTALCASDSAYLTEMCIRTG